MHQSLPYSALALLLTSTMLAGQAEPMRYATRVVDLDSGYLANTTGAERTVNVGTVRFAGGAWLRLHFAEQTNLPERARLDLTSLADRDVQHFDASSLADYRNVSAFLNGEAVRVDVVLPPGARQARVKLAQADVGTPGTGAIGPSTICETVDDRALSTDPRQGRQAPTGCSSWLVNEFTVLTAGHCTASAAQQIHFNVPLSTSGGGLVQPPVVDQYPYDTATLQRLDAGVGSDWTVATTVRNSNTRMYPGQKQGSWYQLGSVPTSPGGQNIRITGYGTVSSPVSPTWQQVQKTHVGPLITIGASSLCYHTDTTGGNSGSPIIHENTGRAIGIHTHGGCSTSTTSCNSGTRIDRADIQASVASRMLLKSVGKWSTFGSGCSGTAGTPSISGAGYPDLNVQATANIAGVKPGEIGVVYIGASNTLWQGNPLPFSLAGIGMGTCFLRTSTEINVPLATGTGTPSFGFTLPINLSLRGVKFYLQYLSRDAGANALGFTMTNGLQALVGD